MFIAGFVKYPGWNRNKFMSAQWEVAARKVAGAALASSCSFTFFATCLWSKKKAPEGALEFSPLEE